MSDYLDNLATRSLNLTEVIQPRLASRFEPANAVDGAVSARHITAEPSDATFTSGETDLSLQTPVQTPTSPSVEPPREAGKSIAEFRQTPLDAPHRTADGLTTTPGQPLVQPTRQQPPLPTHDLPPAAKMGSVQSPAQNTLDPTQLASLQTAPSLLKPSMAQPFTRSAPQQPEPGRSTRSPTADEDGMGSAWSRGDIEQEDHSTLEPAPQPIVIERTVLRQKLRPAGTRERIMATLPRSAGQPDTRPTPAPAIQSRDFEGFPAPMAPASMESSRLEPPPVQETPASIPASIVARPQMIPHVSSRTPRRPPEPAEVSQPAPTIQVTIGRIEVRATPPPAPSPQRQRVASPVMSLDEYLRQRAREGGG